MDACRRRRRAPGWVGPLLAVVVAALSFPRLAQGQAQSPRYQTLLVGDRSMGMGSAFTGLANDGSAVYFNPGGLVARERAAITGGLWLNAFDKKVLDAGIQSDFGSFAMESKTAPNFPAFVASTVNVGKRDDEGLRPWVLAVSSFQARRDQFSSFTEMPDPTTMLTNTLEVEDEARDLYIGVTLTRRFQRVLGAGMSLFLVQRRYYHRETAFAVAGPAPFDMDQSRGTSWASTVSIRSYLLAMRFGALKQLSPKLRGGITVQPPGIPLKSRAKRRFQRLNYELETDPSTSDYEFELADNLRSRAPIPPEVRVGLAHFVHPRVVWTTDLSLVVPVVDREVIDGQQARADALETAAFVVPTTKGVPVANVSLGMEAQLSRLLHATFGVFTDFSSAPRVPATSSAYVAPRLHDVGITASIGARGNNRGMAVGISGLLGRGQGLGVDLSDDGRFESYRRSPIRTRTVFISLTGAIESAEQLARAAAAKVKPGSVKGGELDLPPADPPP